MFGLIYGKWNISLSDRFLIIASLVNFIIVFFKIYYYYDKYLLVIIFLQDLHFNNHYFPCHKALNYFVGKFIIYFYLKIIMCLFPMTLFFKGYNHNFIFNLFMESIILILILGISLFIWMKGLINIIFYSFLFP